MTSPSRAAIVTGAGNGLGAAFAEALAAAGVAVVVNNRMHSDRPHSALAIIERIEARGGVAVVDGHAVDAEGAADALVGAALAAFGRLDVLVLNAGIAGPPMKVGTGDTGVAEVMATNFFANVRLVEAALPHLLASPAGRIVFVSSTGGLHGVRGRAAYAASKGAVNGWALSLADELRRTSVRVNVIAPYAATNMTAQPGRAADPRLAPEGAAAALTWLCDPATDRTGEIWVAGAGHVRAARAMESRAAPAAEIAARADELAAMPEARSYLGGEAAFADFYDETTRGAT
ncbi:SDR family NAD(P)-dependent oxidoreductase [Glacieibacterium frigidum]|uniref:SDR family NAD(P)-dependent oxidoreductase n=1 Tax=Glacieibacterium frigidum TaxID=2593303 RepID=A0A552U762_9SPHN|nr:SDR family NAD(P)-dependent oxidoreductase [Glacieibacterium frigidum]TRW14057.1 SDR family NAD(P)-dependent oxidoreductase [Glacieibacterium frigidum]